MCQKFKIFIYKNFKKTLKKIQIKFNFYVNYKNSNTV